jgi:hypothetical protein
MLIGKRGKTKVTLNVIMAAVINLDQGGFLNNTTLGVIRPAPTECMLLRRVNYATNCKNKSNIP